MRTTYNVSGLSDLGFLNYGDSYWDKYTIQRVKDRELQVVCVSDTLFERVERIFYTVLSCLGFVDSLPQEVLLSKFELQQQLLNFFQPQDVQRALSSQLTSSHHYGAQQEADLRRNKGILAKRIFSVEQVCRSRDLEGELSQLKTTVNLLGQQCTQAADDNSRLSQREQLLREQHELHERVKNAKQKSLGLMSHTAQLSRQVRQIREEEEALQQQVFEKEKRLFGEGCSSLITKICSQNGWDLTDFQDLVSQIQSMLRLKASGNQMWVREFQKIRQFQEVPYYQTAQVLAHLDLLSKTVPDFFNEFVSCSSVFVAEGSVNDVSFETLEVKQREFLQAYGVRVERESTVLSVADLGTIVHGVLIEERKEAAVQTMFLSDYQGNPPFKFLRAGLLSWSFKPTQGAVDPEHLWSLGTLLSKTTVHGENPWQNPKEFSSAELDRFNNEGFYIHQREGFSKVSELCARLGEFTQQMGEFFSGLLGGGIPFSVTSGRKDLGLIFKSHLGLYQAIEADRAKQSTNSIKAWIKQEQTKRQGKIDRAAAGGERNKESGKQTKENAAYDKILSSNDVIKEAWTYLETLVGGENLDGMSKEFLSDLFFRSARRDSLPNLPMFTSAYVEVRVGETATLQQVQALEQALNNSYLQLGFVARTKEAKKCMPLKDGTGYVGFGTNINVQEMTLLMRKFSSKAYVDSNHGHPSLNEAYRAKTLQLSMKFLTELGESLFNPGISPSDGYNTFVNLLMSRGLDLQSKEANPLEIPVVPAAELVVGYIRYGLQPTMKIFHQPTPLPLSLSLCAMLGLQPKSEKEVEDLLTRHSDLNLGSLSSYQRAALNLLGGGNNSFSTHTGHYLNSRDTTGGGAPIRPIKKAELGQIGDLDRLFVFFYRALGLNPTDRSFISLDSNGFRFLFSVIAGALEETEYFKQKVVTDKDLVGQWQKNILQTALPSAVNQLYSMESSGYQDAAALEANDIQGRLFPRLAVTDGLMPILSALGTQSFAQLSTGVGVFLAIDHPFGACLKGFAGQVTDAGKHFFGELLPGRFFCLTGAPNRGLSIVQIARSFEDQVKTDNRSYFIDDGCNVDYNQSFDTMARSLYSSGNLPDLQGNPPNRFDRVGHTAANSLLQKIQNCNPPDFSLRIFASLFLPTYEAFRKCFDEEGNFAELLQELGCTPQQVGEYQDKGEAAQICILTELPWLVLRRLCQLGVLMPIETQGQTFLGQQVTCPYENGLLLVDLVGAGGLGNIREYDISGLLAEHLRSRVSIK